MRTNNSTHTYAIVNKSFLYMNYTHTHMANKLIYKRDGKRKRKEETKRSKEEMRKEVKKVRK